MIDFLDSNEKLFGTFITGFEVLGDVDILKNWDRSIDSVVKFSTISEANKYLSSLSFS